MKRETEQQRLARIAAEEAAKEAEEKPLRESQKAAAEILRVKKGLKVNAAGLTPEQVQRIIDSEGKEI